VFLVVHNSRDQSSAFQQLDQPIQFAGSYDRRRDQYIVDALFHQSLRFMERCGANANSPCGYLPPRNLCAFMALGVRACLQSVDVYLVLIGSYVSLEDLQIQNQGRRRQFAQAARFSYESGVGAGKTVRNVYFRHLVLFPMPAHFWFYSLI
jgi:hypothetical protein